VNQPESVQRSEGIDPWVGCSPANASRLIAALKRFGATVSEISEQDSLVAVSCGLLPTHSSICFYQFAALVI